MENCAIIKEVPNYINASRCAQIKSGTKYKKAELSSAAVVVIYFC